MTEGDFDDLLQMAVDLTRHELTRSATRPGSAVTIALHPRLRDGVRAEGCIIVVEPTCEAPGGELLRIDDHLHDDLAARLAFRDRLILALEPLLEGGRVARDETLQRFVVLRQEPGNGPAPGHVTSPEGTAA